MKRLFCLPVVIAIYLSASAQSNLLPVDKSPMDMSYYPVNYPVLKIQDKITEPLVARVVYSRPRKEARTIFGGLVEFGKLWRLGANEVTEIEFFQKVNIGDKKIPKGRYTLYAIVNETTWTFILNQETDTWGSFRHIPEKDVVRITVPVEKINDPLEYFAIAFEKVNSQINLVIAWENVKVALPITL